MLEGQFAYFVAAIAATPEMGAAGHADAMRVVAALQPWANGRQYLNFAENPTDAANGYDAAAYARLQAIRTRVDPDGLMVANHKVAAPPVVPAPR
jgi:FAD/FMN-containing dehydrogenase